MVLYLNTILYSGILKIKNTTMHDDITNMNRSSFKFLESNYYIFFNNCHTLPGTLKICGLAHGNACFWENGRTARILTQCLRIL